MKKLDYLIKYLIDENDKKIITEIPEGYDKKFATYRALSNIRLPKKVDEEYLKIEDEVLHEYNQRRGIIKNEDILLLEQTHPDCNIINKDKIALYQGDITKMSVDAIVNAANSRGLGCFIPCHNCIDNQIHSYAGIRLRLDCDKFMKSINYNLPTSQAFTTRAYNLPSEYVIHTVGPIIDKRVRDEDKRLLADTYINSLNEAIRHDIKSIAFPSISTGVFSFPKDLAAQIVLKTLDKYITEHEDDIDKVVISVYKDKDRDIYERFIKDYK